MTPAMLTKEAFAASRKFIETTARPLEIARFRHAFDGGSGEFIFDALRKYQNPDGGFGHALEPDLRAKESSALCTSIAFQILRATTEKPAAGFVSQGIAYFLNTLDRDNGHWRIIPRSSEASPHAPWWNQTGREEAFDSFSLNPTAEILGYLVDYQEKVPSDLLSKTLNQVIKHISDSEEVEMHELLCIIRLFKTKALPGKLHKRGLKKLIALIDDAVAWDPAKWEGYSLRPLQVIDSPESPFMAGRAQSVTANLDYEISTQKEDGSWTPTWSWGDAYPNDWKLAYREWSGIITLNMLLLLRRFNRIEGID